MNSERLTEEEISELSISQLRLKRQQRGWSQSELAKTLGTTRNIVSCWENGLTVPNPYFRERLRELGLPFEVSEKNVEESSQANELNALFSELHKLEFKFQSASTGNSKSISTSQYTSFILSIWGVSTPNFFKNVIPKSKDITYIHVTPDDHVKRRNKVADGLPGCHKYWSQTYYEFRKISSLYCSIDLSSDPLIEKMLPFPSYDLTKLMSSEAWVRSIAEKDLRDIIAFRNMVREFFLRTPFFSLSKVCHDESLICDDSSPEEMLLVLCLFLKKIYELISYLKRQIVILKRLTAEAIRLQYVANYTRNRMSSSPTPQKKEPPIGGIKVGGEQHDGIRHVVEKLYFKQQLAA